MNKTLLLTVFLLIAVGSYLAGRGSRRAEDPIEFAFPEEARFSPAPPSYAGCRGLDVGVMPSHSKTQAWAERRGVNAGAVSAQDFARLCEDLRKQGKFIDSLSIWEEHAEEVLQVIKTMHMPCQLMTCVAVIVCDEHGYALSGKTSDFHFAMPTTLEATLGYSSWKDEYDAEIDE